MASCTSHILAASKMGHERVRGVGDRKDRKWELGGQRLESGSRTTMNQLGEAR